MEFKKYFDIGNTSKRDWYLLRSSTSQEVLTGMWLTKEEANAIKKANLHLTFTLSYEKKS